MENLELLVKELCKLNRESEWLEFKHNNDDPYMIGKDISALANSALLRDRTHAYMIWGVNDDTHEIIGTKVHLSDLKRGNQEVENWLRSLLSKNADFEFKSVEINGKHVEIIIISKAVGVPVSFEKVSYVRIGSYTQRLDEYDTLQAQLWDKLRNEQFEDIFAKIDLTFEQVSSVLNCDRYFEMLHITPPTDKKGYIHYFEEEGIIKHLDNGLYAITNLGAILFAKRLAEFPKLGRKAIRVVQYEDNTRLTIMKEKTFSEGYGTDFENAVNYVIALLPSKEDIESVRRKTHSVFPFPAIREGIANSIIHQDFFISGTGPLIEIFANRIEITNPGTPLVEIKRIIDNPPKSRNEKLASLMRRMGMCEELGRGWDRMVMSCELKYLPAPRIQIYQDSTKVSIFSHLDFSNIPMDDKLWAKYMHACIRYVEGDSLSNSSLRERFGLKDSYSGSISRLIKEAVENKSVKPLDPTTARRYMRYIPFWA